MLINNISELIGNTPILRISSEISGLKNIELYAKLENLNPFGSVKDRTAYHMLKYDVDQIQHERRTVIETSSGNTAKALVCLCNIHKIPFKTVTNRIKVSESRNILKFLGAQIEEVTKDVDTVEKILQEINDEPNKYYHTTQYTNSRNIDAHYITGKEIHQDIGEIDYFFGVLGTSGSSRGMSMYLKEKNQQLTTIGIVTAKDSYIPGIRSATEMKEVGIYKNSNYDQILEVSGVAAKHYMKKLSRELGVLAGPSSGASFCGAVEYLRKIDNECKQGTKAVFVVCDRLETYANYIKDNRFCKYHVCGNTYIVIDPADNQIRLSEGAIKRLCDKDLGIGADGIVFGPFVSNGRYTFRAFNSDGTEANSAFFGAMIFARYLIDKEILKLKNFTVYIGAVELHIRLDDRDQIDVRLQCDEPCNLGEIEIGKRLATFITTGNNNLVFEHRSPSKELVEKINQEVILSNLFSSGINIQAVKVIDQSHLYVESFERGSGYTVSSGTGIMSACYAFKERLSETITIHTPGGICEVTQQNWSIKGSVFKILEGEIDLESFPEN